MFTVMIFYVGSKKIITKDDAGFLSIIAMLLDALLIIAAMDLIV
jgi:hypothetical protein